MMDEQTSSRPAVMDGQGKKPSGAQGAVLTGAAGLGLGALLMSILQDQPQVISQIIGWGPGIMILAGGVYFGAPFAKSLLESHQTMTRNVGDLAVAIRENLSRDDDVRMAVRHMAAEVSEVHKLVRERLTK